MSKVAPYNLNQREYSFLLSLNTPIKIQDFLDSISFNHEENGETCMSPRRTLREKKAHCVEGALLAATCLLLQNKKPVVVSLKVTENDYDHIITIYKEQGFFGAISMTNHGVLGYRDPIYRSIRELIMTYFHEYFLTTTGEKTLLGYSRPIHLLRFGTDWITSEDELFEIAESLYDAPYTAIIPKNMSKYIRKADLFTCHVASISKETYKKTTE